MCSTTSVGLNKSKVSKGSKLTNNSRGTYKQIKLN